MLDIAEIRAIAEQVARDQFGAASIDDVFAEETTDWYGDDALSVSVILRPEAVGIVHDGKKLTAALGALSDQLQALGDMRFPVIRYATRADLQRGTRARSKS